MGLDIGDKNGISWEWITSLVIWQLSMDQLLKNATMASQTFGDLSMKPDESG